MTNEEVVIKEEPVINVERILAKSKVVVFCKACGWWKHGQKRDRGKYKTCPECLNGKTNLEVHDFITCEDN